MIVENASRQGRDHEKEDTDSRQDDFLNVKGETTFVLRAIELDNTSREAEFEHIKQQIKWLYIWLYVCLGTLNPFIAGYFYEIFHFSTNAVGFLNGLSPMMNLIAAPLWGYLADRLSSKSSCSSSSGGHPQARKYILLLVLTMTTVADLSMSLYRSADDSSVTVDDNNADKGINNRFWILVALRLWSAIFYSSVKGLMDSYTIGCLSEFTPDASKLHGKLARTWGEVATGITSATVGQLIYSSSTPGSRPRFELAFGLRALSFIPLVICLLSIRQKGNFRNDKSDTGLDNCSKIPSANLSTKPFAVKSAMPTQNFSGKGSTNHVEDDPNISRIQLCGTPELLNDDGNTCSTTSVSFSPMQTSQSNEDCDSRIDKTNSMDTDENDSSWSSSLPPTASTTHAIHENDDLDQISSSCTSERAVDENIDSCIYSYELALPRQPPSFGPPIVQRGAAFCNGPSEHCNKEGGDIDETQWSKILGFFVLVFANGLTCRYIETFASICIRMTANQTLADGSAQILGESDAPILALYGKFLLQLDAGRTMSICRICLSVGGTFAYYYLTPWLLQSEGNRGKFWNVYRLNGLTVILYGMCSVLYGSETLIGCIVAETLRGITYAVQWTACTHHVQTLSIQGAGRSTLQTLLEAVYKGLGASIGCMLGGNLLGHFRTLLVAFWEIGKCVILVGCTIGLLVESMVYIDSWTANTQSKRLHKSAKLNDSVNLKMKKRQ